MEWKIPFKKEKAKPEMLIGVKEARIGIQTYVNQNLHLMDEAYKDQLITFLEGVVKKLKQKN